MQNNTHNRETTILGAMQRSDMMFAAPENALYQKEIEVMEAHGAMPVPCATEQNCVIGKRYPVPQFHGIHPGGLRYHWRDTPNGPEVRECKPGEVCSDGGGRSRREFCGDCDKIV